MIKETVVGDQPVASTEGSMGLAPGIVSGRYRVSEIASVSRDVVRYVAEDIRSGRPIALEVLRDEFARDNDFVTALLNQASKLAKSAHVNRAVARVYECDKTEDGHVFIARESVEGRTLREVLDERGPLDPHAALRVASQVGEALEMLHHNGIVHGELGLESVLMVKDDDGTENARLVGVELTSAHRTKVSRSLLEARPPAYVAPEQAEFAQTTEAADVYALGRLLKDLLTANTTSGTNGARPTVATVPPAVERIIATAIDARPSQRYADISVMVNSIWAAHTALSEVTARPASVKLAMSTQPHLRTGGSVLAIAPVVATAAIVAVVIAWAAMSDRIASHFRSRVAVPTVTSVPSDASATSPPIDTGTATPPRVVESPKSAVPSGVDAMAPQSGQAVTDAVATPEAASSSPPAPAASAPSAIPRKLPSASTVVHTERSGPGGSRPRDDRSVPIDERGATGADRRVPGARDQARVTTTGQRGAAVTDRHPSPRVDQRVPATPEQRAPVATPTDERATDAGDGTAIIDWLLKERR